MRTGSGDGNRNLQRDWIPACAGMTKTRSPCKMHLTPRKGVLSSFPMVSQFHIATDMMMSMPSPGAGVVSCGWLGVAVR